MGYIATWINDEQQMEQASMVVEDTLNNLMTRSGLIDTIAPLKTYDDRDFLMYVIDKIQTVASVIAYGAEVPVTNVGRFLKLTGELFKSGLAFDYPEEKQWAMQKAMDLAALKNLSVQDTAMADGSVMRGVNNTLADYLFGTIKDLTAAQVTLLDSLTWQALQFGQVAYTDQRTNTNLVLNYLEEGATYNHFPAALSGADLWTASTTANGLDIIEQDIETYIDTNGMRPEMIVMSRKARRLLLNQESTKRAISSINNTSANVIINNVGSVSPEMLSNILQIRDLPPIVIFDEMYNIENLDKTFTRARFLNTDRYVFVSPNMGERAMGPTLEANGATGIFVKTDEITRFPPRDASRAVATMLPVFPRPKLFFSRKVA